MEEWRIGIGIRACDRRRVENRSSNSPTHSVCEIKAFLLVRGLIDDHEPSPIRAQEPIVKPAAVLYPFVKQFDLWTFSAMAPAFVVINHPQWALEPTSALAGIYSKLSQVPPITPSGPPLPVVVQCLPGDVLDLEPIAQIVERLSGVERNPANAWEGFVKDVVAALEAADLTVLPHIDTFFGIVQSRTANKYVAIEWDTDDNDAVYHIFSTFIAAFIYVLAGGNDNLKKWGLKRYMGTERVKKNTASRLEGPVPVLLSDFLKSVKGLGRKGKEKAKEEVSIGSITVPDSTSAGPSVQVDVDIQPQIEERVSPCLAENSDFQSGEKVPLSFEGRATSAVLEGNPSPGPAVNAPQPKRSPSPIQLEGNAVDSEPTAEVSTVPRLTSNTVGALPDHLVPTDYLQDLPEALRFVPFMHRRKAYGIQVVHADRARLTQVNGPFQLVRNHEVLPPFILFYLRSHGWSDRVIEVVAIAYTCEATLTGFLTAMSRENMPLSEASFLWHALSMHAM
ncbi:hypothetical protein NMY22_g7766 [Coprinellus aureogranulatus]|nr:hypothetical protein NMY22_g7766 [Coprinellus aureogranulatus]